MSSALHLEAACAFVGVLALMSATHVAAQSTSIAQLQYSADTGANIVGPGRFASRKDYVADDLAGNRAAIAIAGLPDRVDLRDFQIDPNGDVLFCLDVGTTLGGIYFRPADVVRLSGTSFSKAFDATAAGVPTGVSCDGVARSGTGGALLLSFDTTFTVGAITVRPADVIAYDAGFGAKVLDAQALGLPSDANVDAVDALGVTTDLLLSFDSAGQVSGVSFADEDVLQLHLADSSWSKRFTMITFSDRWARANLDGLATAPNGDRLFKDGFE